MARLIGRTGAVAGRDFVLDDNTRLGAANENDIRITAEGVSRRHARIFREGNAFWIEDTGATNGTFLNGSRVHRETLRHLDVITLGRSVDLIFLSRENEPPPAPEADQLIDVKLEILDGADAGKAVDVPRGEITMGRAASCNVVLHSPAVGRAHARIERSARRLLLQDLQSANGTFVNGTRIDGTAVLASGDVIGLGGVRSFTVRIHGTPSPLPAAGELPPDDARYINQEWKTRFMWGPEELAQIEAARENAIARANLRELRAVTDNATEAPAMRVAATTPAPAAAAPAPAAVAAKADAPGVKAPSMVEAPVPPKAAAPASSGAERPAAPKSEIQAAPVAASPKAPAAAPDAAIPGTPGAPAAAASASARPVAPPVPKPAASPVAPAAAKRVSSHDPTTRFPTGLIQVQGIILVGPGGPIRLGRGTFKIGRAMDAEVRLEDRQVSRAHASLVVDEMSATVEDLKTVNGTLVNGHEVKGRAPLKSGDTMRFGDSELTVELITGV